MSIRREGKLKRRYKYGIGILITFVIMSEALYYIQETLIFRPTQLKQDYQFEFQHDFEEIFLDVSENVRLNALLFRSTTSMGVILYLHGNSGDLSRWGTIAGSLVDLDYDVFVLDYRTYGKSVGKMGEEALYNDAQYCYDYLLKRYDENDIIIYGRSLGTGIATYLASKNSPKKLLLETPYYSLVDVAQYRFPLFPVSKLLKYKIPSYQYIQDVKCPINIIHGSADIVVPLSSGEKLFKVAPKERTEMTVVEGGGHNNLMSFDEYEKWIENLLKD